MQHQTFSSAKLKQIRRAAGVSRTQLASACRVSASTVAEWEQGKYSPRIATLAAVVAALDCRVEDLFEVVDA